MWKVLILASSAGEGSGIVEVLEGGTGDREAPRLVSLASTLTDARERRRIVEWRSERDEARILVEGRRVAMLKWRRQDAVAINNRL